MALPVIHLDRAAQAAFTGWSGEVNTFANLPLATSSDGQFWMVLNPTGSRFLFTYKASGLYLAESGSWRKINNAQLLLNDAQFSVYNSADNTKQISFNVASITTGTRRTATWPDKDGVVAMFDDVITIHNNLSAIQGGAVGEYNHITNLELLKVQSIDQVYTLFEKNKLSGIEALSQVNTINSIIGGTDIVVDITDPLNPIINATGGGGVETIQINLGTTISSGAAASGFIILGNELVYEVTGSNPNSFDKVAWFSFKVPTNYSSGGTFKIETWTDDNAVSLLANLYINDVVDATINSLDIEPSTTLTWENKSSAIGSVIVADDRISIRLVYTVPNGDNVRIRNISFDYNT